MVTVTKKTKTEGEQPQGAAQVESLEALASEAQTIDNPIEAQAQAAQVAQQAAQVAQQQAIKNNAAELEQAAMIVRAMALPLLPEEKAEKLARVWTDAVIKQASAAGAAVMDLHGLSMGDVMGKYAPYIALAASLAPPVLATVRIMKEPEPQPQKTVPDGQQQQA